MCTYIQGDRVIKMVTYKPQFLSLLYCFCKFTILIPNNVLIVYILCYTDNNTDNMNE